MSKTLWGRLSAMVLACWISGVGATEPVWIDVRSAAEHSADNIDGDIRVNHTDIVEEVARRFPDKTQEIHLYCARGGRAGLAKNALWEAGYTNVFNAGGIDDARAERKLAE